MSAAAHVEALRARIADWLPLIIEDLESLIECSCTPRIDEATGGLVPVAHTIDPDALADVSARLIAVRDMEEEIGRRVPMKPWLRDLVAHGLPRSITVAEIIAEVAALGGCEPTLLTGTARDKESVWMRDLVIKLALEFTTLSQTQIGRELGRRDHSTICTAIQRIDQVRRLDEAWVSRLVRLRRQIHPLTEKAHG